MSAFTDFIKELFSIMTQMGLHPRVLLAVGVGLPTAWVGTQFIKKWLFLHGWRARVLASVLGFFPTFFIIPGWWPEPFWIALLVALGAPAAYKILIAFASNRWEWVRDLSSECAESDEHAEVDK